MNIVFFGTDSFAKDILQYLIEKGIKIDAVVTQTDKPSGRKKKITPPPVKAYLLESGFTSPIYQPDKASSQDFIDEIEKHKPDLFVVVAYGQIMKQNLLDLPKFGSINVHASLLPKYRGAAPMQRAVMAGEKEVGVTIMELVLACDAGAIIKTAKMPLPGDMTYGEVKEKLCELSKPVLLETIKEFRLNGKVNKTPQDEALVTYAKKIEVEESFIDWKKPAIDIHNFIRGLNPKPAARCKIEINNTQKILKVFRSEVAMDNDQKEAYDKINGWVISCANNSFIRLLEVQIEGKNRIGIKDFINGFSRPKIC